MRSPELPPIISKNILRVIPPSILLTAILGCSVSGLPRIKPEAHLLITGPLSFESYVGAVVLDSAGNTHYWGIGHHGGKWFVDR